MTYATGGGQTLVWACPHNQQLSLSLFSPCPHLSALTACKTRSEDRLQPHMAADRATGLYLAIQQPGRHLGSAPLLGCTGVGTPGSQGARISAG